MNKISHVTRRNIFDGISLNEICWNGRLDETDFLSRIFDLKKLPSFDHRFSDASGDIWQHRINNYDWKDDWIFTDGRFALLHCNDEIFLKFLCEMLHPIVRNDKEEIKLLLKLFNENLSNDKFEIFEHSKISDKPIFAARSYLRKNKKQIPWVRVFNNLFLLVNKEGENSYFSGPRFINIIREFDVNFPSYTQFINERGRNGKSTSRREYFYDILLSLEESIRLNIIKRILSEIESENKSDVSEIRKLINEGDVYHTVFISYGGSDEDAAAIINDYLKSKGIKTWFFRDNALPGQKLHRIMYEGVNNYDRVLFICSEQSLKRQGVLNELERVLEREAKEGGSEILLPIRLDDYVLTDWAPEKRDIADQVRSRVIVEVNIENPESESTLKQLEKIVFALSKKNKIPY